MTLKIYGYSDDNVELEGDIHEEFYVPGAGYDNQPLIVLSNGVVLRVTYDNDGIWRFTPLKGSDKVFVIHNDQSDIEGSDVVMIDDTVTFAVCGTSLVEKAP